MSRKKRKEPVLDFQELGDDTVDQLLAIRERAELDDETWELCVSRSLHTVQERWPVVVERLGEDDYYASVTNKQDYFIALLEHLIGPPTQKTGA